jgi:hypothetical protein
MTVNKPHDSHLINVRVLYTADCAATPATIATIQEVTAEMELQVHLETVLVGTLEQALALKFLGSPTVQINGLDIDPAARHLSSYGFM